MNHEPQTRTTKFGVLGTGMVGQTLAGKLVALGHEVLMGSRQTGNEKATAWAAQAGPLAHEGSFADAAAFGEMIVNATAGIGSLDALAGAAPADLNGKILIDVANPLDSSGGMPPVLTVCNTDSLAEQIQRAHPTLRVVKTLNTVSADVMVDPAIVPAPHTMFLAGEDAAAKAEVAGLLQSFGWPAESLMDLGDIRAARGTEMYLALWLRLWGATGTGHLNIHVAQASASA